MIIQDLRYLIRSSSLAGLVPYVSNSSSFNFKNTPVNQINPGEFFWNQEDKKLWLGYQDASNNLGVELIYPQPVTGGSGTDVFVTGGTYSAGTATFTNNTGGTFNVTGFVSADTFTTGFSYNNNTFTINQNNGGGNLTATINSVTGLTSTGTITSSVISATTYQGFATARYSSGTVQGFLQTHIYPGSTSSGHGPNTMRGYYITIEKDVTIDTIYCRATATNASARITYAIYNLTSSGYPNTKLFNSTEFTFATAGIQTEAVSLTLSAGTYVVASILNSASGTMVGVGRQNMYNTGIGTLDFGAGANFLPQGYTVSQTYSTTLPTTFPAGATSTGTAALPALWFKVT
jgi:hypothetical protein